MDIFGSSCNTYFVATKAVWFFKWSKEGPGTWTAYIHKDLIVKRLTNSKKKKIIYIHIYIYIYSIECPKSIYTLYNRLQLCGFRLLDSIFDGRNMFCNISLKFNSIKRVEYWVWVLISSRVAMSPGIRHWLLAGQDNGQW